MHRGYMAIWRKIQDHEFYTEKRKYSKLEAWLDILLEAQHQEERDVIIGMKLFKCYYGESLKSVRTWGRRWGWGEATVKRFLKLLEKMNQIRTKSETVTTRLTVLNYYKYDPRRHTSDTREERKRNARGTQVATDNKGKNVKNEKNINIPKKSSKKKTEAPKDFPITEEMRSYANKKNYNSNVESMTEKFLNHHRAKGNKFVNWYSAWQNWLLKDIEYNPDKVSHIDTKDVNSLTEEERYPDGT